MMRMQERGTRLFVLHFLFFFKKKKLVQLQKQQGTIPFPFPSLSAPEALRRVVLEGTGPS
jgi:hypothetical protein